VPIPGVTTLTRPDRVPGMPFWIQGPTAPGGKTLNPAAFVAPPTPRQGTLGRNAVTGFGFTQVDLSAARKVVITERLNLQFRADIFNLFNHANFADPGFPIINSGSFFLRSASMLNAGLGGLSPLYQQGGPRSVQFSLKLVF
jgi:hypothetical protein